MEKFPRFERKNLGVEEQIRGLKKSLIDICIKLKASFEIGYDAFVSDDTGGRIPTLFLREIYKQVKGESPKTLFIASGSGYIPKTETEKKQLTEYIERGIGKSKKVLLITQYVHSGDTVNFLAEQLKNHGVEVTDLTTMYLNPMSDISEDINVFGGRFDPELHWISEDHTLISDITKSKQYNPEPMRLDKALEDGERDKRGLIYSSHNEFNTFANINNNGDRDDTISKLAEAEIKLKEKEYSSGLTVEDKVAIQNNINYVRSLIKTVATEIVAEVWPEKM